MGREIMPPDSFSLRVTPPLTDYSGVDMLGVWCKFVDFGKETSLVAEWAGFRVQGSGFRVQGSGLGVEGFTLPKGRRRSWAKARASREALLPLLPPPAPPRAVPRLL